MNDNVGEISRLIAYAKELSFPLDIETNFLTRFKLQKLAFLLRVLNNEEIDDFNIYTHGPYSPNETAGYYEYARGQIQIEKVEVNKEKLEKVREVFSVNDNLVEGATTMISLIRSGSATWKDAYQKLKEIKPNLSLSDLVDSVNLAKRLLMTKEMEEELREEAQKDVEKWTKISSAAEDKDE